MSTSILVTKLHTPPPRPGAVLRARLIEHLDAGLAAGRKLTLVSAPAGFGKTTLLGEWVTGCGRPVAWLSLDESDGDPARFLAYLVAALRMLVVQGPRGESEPAAIAASIGEGVLAALRFPQPPVEFLLITLLNEIAAVPGGLVVVLDDYHTIDSRAVDDELGFLVEHLPPQMHLVIATREDPRLPLARLRARGQLTELRAADLRFTPAEAAEFLNGAMGLDLSADDIAALETRTEGWIAGLQMAALSVQGRSDTAGFIRAFTGSHRFVLDYLVEEVLVRRPERVRSFLLQTAILDRLCGPLCDAVTEAEDGRAMLDTLERGNLFVLPLDDECRWYRYHHLFADVLRARLSEEQPEQVSGLHRRASMWYEQNGLPSEAIRHALAAGDFERAAGLIELAHPAMDRSLQSAAWLAWAKALPDELIRDRPVLSADYAWALLDGGEMEACVPRLQDAERWLDSQAGASDRPEVPSTGPRPDRRREMVVVDKEQFRLLPASIATARAYRALALGDISRAADYARRALDMFPGEDHQWRVAATSLLGLAQYAGGDLEGAERSLAAFLTAVRTAGDVTTVLGITFLLADIRTALGRLREAVSTYRQALQFAASRGEPMPPGTSDLHRGIGELHREQGDLQAAARHLLTGRQLGEGAALTGWASRLCIAQARMKEAEGDLDGALPLLDEAERLYVRAPLPDVRPIAALRAQLWIRQGRLAEALGWAHERGLSADDDLSYACEFEHITLARLLIARYREQRAGNSIHEAAGLLERLLRAAEDGGRGGSVIEVLVLQALAHQARGDMRPALASLERALALAEPEGYVQVFLSEGAPMAALLREAAQHGTAPKYVRRLLAALGEPGTKAPAAQPLIEPLSERELEVLRLLGTELDGPEIARKLMVSLSTVRTHTRNIYAKLGVNSRRAAVRRAEELDLL